MAAEWAYRLFPTLRAAGVPIVLWYAHGTVTRRLYLALRCADRVLTSSAEGFRIASPKVHVIGQGVDTDRFRILPPPATADRIVSVGRLSPRKRVEVLIRALAEIRGHPDGRDMTLQIIGGPTSRADRRYAEGLHDEIARLGLGEAVEFTGPLSAEEVARRHADAFVHVNVSATGSMDKSVLEALACGRPVLTSNEAYRTLLPDLVVDAAEPALLAARVLDLRRQRSAYCPEAMRARVVGRHDLRGYVERVISHLAEVRAT
jgi:glycosyltransferase involved in cell wall biosynthesis